jgi:hypothetical protein
MTIHAAAVRNWEKLLHLPFQSSLPLLSIRNISSVLQIDVERPAIFAGRLLYHSFRNHSCLPACYLRALRQYFNDFPTPYQRAESFHATSAVSAPHAIPLRVATVAAQRRTVEVFSSIRKIYRGAHSLYVNNRVLRSCGCCLDGWHHPGSSNPVDLARLH